MDPTPAEESLSSHRILFLQSNINTLVPNVSNKDGYLFSITIGVHPCTVGTTFGERGPKDNESPVSTSCKFYRMFLTKLEEPLDFEGIVGEDILSCVSVTTGKQFTDGIRGTPIWIQIENDRTTKSLKLYVRLVDLKRSGV